jgi:hypothetical protein
LYLFLITVCDGEGLSYYSDATLARLLHLDSLALARARQELISADLIAYQSPLYQVLALEDPPQQVQPPPATQSPPAQQPSPATPRQPNEPPLSIGQILQQMMVRAQ